MTALKRLKRRKEFLIIADKGKRWAAPGLVLQALLHDSVQGERSVRVGFTVSRKAARSAVVRNRIRRRLKAVVQDVIPGLDLPACDLVVIGRQAGIDRPFEALAQDLKTALEKTGVLVK